MDFPHLQSCWNTLQEARSHSGDLEADQEKRHYAKKERTVFIPIHLPRILPRHVQSIGQPHLRTFKCRLPDNLIQCLPKIVQACDRYAASHGGWETQLFSVTRQDIALADVRECALLSHCITNAVTETVHAILGSHVYMDRNQPHILKYDAGHRMTPFHHDHCHLTINLMLSSRQSYQGGGTQILDVGTVMLDQGEYLIHPGPLLHRGCEITQGTRYLLVFFVNFLHPPHF